MLPVLLLVGIGGRHPLWIPLPTILLWPLWLLGWTLWLVMWMFRASWQRPLRAALVAGAHLSGLRVDVDSPGGDHIRFRMI
jgi:hypothetical protein